MARSGTTHRARNQKPANADPALGATSRTLSLSRRAETGASIGAPDVPRDPDLEVLARECAIQIEREVSTMKSLVDEFSKFVRFPQARLGPPTSTPSSVKLWSFSADASMESRSTRNSLLPLPQIKADSELLRRVIVNLIDNAAEAMEGSRNRELTILTRNSHIGEMLEIVVCDTGRGISPEDKDKLFLPHFSTKNRGTGLGLAIASRVIAEHNGSIRVEDNLPTGSRFIVCLPAMEVAAIPLGSEV